jgi:hypothetical protein
MHPLYRTCLRQFHQILPARRSKLIAEVRQKTEELFDVFQEWSYYAHVKDALSRNSDRILAGNYHYLAAATDSPITYSEYRGKRGIWCKYSKSGQKPCFHYTNYDDNVHVYCWCCQQGGAQEYIVHWMHTCVPNAWKCLRVSHVWSIGVLCADCRSLYSWKRRRRFHECVACLNNVLP